MIYCVKSFSKIDKNSKDNFAITHNIEGMLAIINEIISGTLPPLKLGDSSHIVILSLGIYRVR